MLELRLRLSKPLLMLAHQPLMYTPRRAVSSLSALYHIEFLIRLLSLHSPAHVNSSLFPPESVVGFPGPTPTGVEPFAIETAKSYPYNDESANRFPLIIPQPHGSNAASPDFDITKYWGNLSPWYSLRSADYGLPDASPLAPQGCDVTQMHLLYRHGARYPTSGAAPGTFAQKLVNATKTGFSVSGELAFLNDWTYKLGAELLTPFGRSQNFMLGVAYRQLYGHLLNNFTASRTLPVFRTESQDRMVRVELGEPV